MELTIKNARTSYLLVVAMTVIFFLIHLYIKEIDSVIIDTSTYNESNSYEYLRLIVKHTDHDNITSTKKRLAVLVPLRNAFDELIVFLPALTSFLSQHQIPFKIFLINQVDELRFNRGALLNVGYLYVRNECDYVILHDVDMLPVKNELSYEYPGNDSVYHVIPNYLHPNPKLLYVDYLGAILAVPNQVYEMVDGISNNFWGWGGEDDDFGVMLRKYNVTIRRTSQLVGNKSDTFTHIHNKNRPRDKISCRGQDRETFMNREPNSGLNSTQFVIKSVQSIAIDSCYATLLNVELHCDKDRTPWCDCVSVGASLDSLENEYDIS